MQNAIYQSDFLDNLNQSLAMGVVTIRNLNFIMIEKNSLIYDFLWNYKSML